MPTLLVDCDIFTSCNYVELGVQLKLYGGLKASQSHTQQVYCIMEL